MNTDEMLRREMLRAAEEMPVRDDLEARFRSRRRHYRRIQLMQVAAAAAVFAAIAVVVVPRIGGEPQGSGFENPGAPSPAETPRSSPTPPPGTFATDSIVGYEVSLPALWNQRVDPGAIAAFAPQKAGDVGESGSAGVPSQYYVLVTPTQLRYQDELDRIRTLYGQLERDGVQTTERETTVGEHPAVSWGAIYPTDIGEEHASDEGWCNGCRVSDYLVHWSHGYTVRIELVARSQQAEEQWGGTGLQVLASFVAAPAAAYAPEHGTLDASVPADDATEIVLQFMDARITGDGADMWLSAEARNQYEAPDGDLSLYSPTSNPHYASYRVLRRDGVDANSFEFVVEIVSEYTGQGQTGTHRETLSVGPGRNQAGTMLIDVIRAAR